MAASHCSYCGLASFHSTCSAPAWSPRSTRATTSFVDATARASMVWMAPYSDLISAASADVATSFSSGPADSA